MVEYVQMKAKKIVVIARLGRSADRNFFSGVLAYARTKSNWSIKLIQMPEEFTPEAMTQIEQDGLDGIISCETGTKGVLPLLEASKIPLVLVGSHPETLHRRKISVAFLTVDEEEIGRFAFRHLSSLGNFRSYAFVPSFESTLWSNLRCKGFMEAGKQAGKRCSPFKGNASHLLSWVQALPKPTAVLCAWDVSAVRLLEVCKEAKVSVPDQLVILGVNDDELLCLSASPSLSSIRPGAEKEGRIAAQALDRLMRHRTDKPLQIRYTQNAVTERETTRSVAPATHLIREGLAFIEQNAVTGIEVEDVVRHLGVSRRLADLRFRQFHEMSIGEQIRETRLKELRRRIRETKLPLGQLTAECGFQNAEYAKTLFKRRFGMTMRDCRAKIRR